VPKLQLLVTSRYNGSINRGIESAGRLEIRAHNDDIKTSDCSHPRVSSTGTSYWRRSKFAP